MRSPGRLALPVVALLATASVAACGSSGPKAASGDPASPAGSAAVVSGATTVTIKDFAFSPSSLTVKVGTKVTFVNQDGVTHTATDTGTFDSGQLANGKSYTLTFDTPGTFDYICSIHPYMKASITVTS